MKRRRSSQYRNGPASRAAPPRSAPIEVGPFLLLAGYGLIGALP